MLVHIIGADDVVVSLVELLLVRPCQMSAILSTESEVLHLRNLFGVQKLLNMMGKTYTTFGVSAIFRMRIKRTDRLTQRFAVR